ncbi:MAG: lipopolysaccharide heptosyltransferase I [Desulfobacterales bacterium]|nr:lipopolysaccharide heptosyltransferase I [Desulfobacteraceae bacterium]MBT4363375.1 lipopolysaccharide heptosyltransferase I [Desulfobacteraceae bacterium]MBT7086665.1 lipopolysaccharide heptosyltransferase I [Desulfobacterales bacterium]
MSASIVNVEIKNILIVKLSAIGDVIHTLPALTALRKKYPEARITWLVEETASSMIEGHNSLDRVLVSKRKRWLRNLKSPSWRKSFSEAYNFFKELRDTRYDLILDFQALLKSGVLIAIAKGNRKIGFDKGMEHMEHSYLFLNERIAPVDMEIHALKRGLMLLDSIGIYTDEIEYNISVAEHELLEIDNLLKQYGIKQKGLLVAINPVAKWDTKLWSKEKFAQLADRLVEQYEAEIVFTGGPEDFDIVQEIISCMKCDAVNLAGKTTLKTLAALYKKADLLISTDTGPMHLGAAVGAPVVAIFGPTAPWRTGPYGKGHKVIRTELECSPCFKRKCETNECMEMISVQDVFEGIKNTGLLNKGIVDKAGRIG